MNKLTYLRPAEPHINAKGRKRKRAYYLCFCGNEFNSAIEGVNSGVTKSCGCLVKILVSKERKTHGLSHTKIHKTWSAIKNRCYNKKCEKYPIYGGRGIKVCDRWLESFENFYEDMNEGCRPNMQIDRIDNDGNYEPNNCRWVTRAENVRNRSVTIYVLHNGTKITLVEFCELNNIPYKTLWARLRKNPNLTECLKEPFKRGYTGTN